MTLFLFVEKKNIMYEYLAPAEGAHSLSLTTASTLSPYALLSLSFPALSSSLSLSLSLSFRRR